MTGFMYLASPYTHPDPVIRELRYLKTTEALQQLLVSKVWTYSPIVHCHELAKVWDMPREAKFWEEYNKAMLSQASILCILALDGWLSSEGIKTELAFALSHGKPVVYIEDGDYHEVLNAWGMIWDKKTPSASSA